jgi:hypothetical protein
LSMAISHRERRRKAEEERRAAEQPSTPAGTDSGKRPRGGQNGNQNRLTHGLVAFQNKIHRRTRRGRSLIDRRSAAGKNAVAIGDELLRDLGGEENCSTAKLMLIEMVRRDVYFCDEIDRRIFKFIYEANTQLPKSKKNPKYISTLYSYRQGVVNNLARNLQALGLEKVPPKVKSLEEILSEDENEGEQNGGE